MQNNGLWGKPFDQCSVQPAYIKIPVNINCGPTLPVLKAAVKVNFYTLAAAPVKDACGNAVLAGNGSQALRSGQSITLQKGRVYDASFNGYQLADNGSGQVSASLGWVGGSTSGTYQDDFYYSVQISNVHQDCASGQWIAQTVVLTRTGVDGTVQWAQTQNNVVMTNSAGVATASYTSYDGATYNDETELWNWYVGWRPAPGQ